MKLESFCATYSRFCLRSRDQHSNICSNSCRTECQHANINICSKSIQYLYGSLLAGHVGPCISPLGSAPNLAETGPKPSETVRNRRKSPKLSQKRIDHGTHIIKSLMFLWVLRSVKFYSQPFHIHSRFRTHFTAMSQDTAISHSRSHGRGPSERRSAPLLSVKC